MVNGKSKGNEFERVIAKKLSLWWSDNERTDLFWRTSNSGGRFTVRKSLGEDTYQQSGDICDTYPDGKFLCDHVYLECKSYKVIGLWSIITGKGQLIDWWKVAIENSKLENKSTFLIVKENNKPILLFTNLSNIPGLQYIASFYCDKEVYIYLFEDFIRKVNVENFKNIFKE